MNVETYTPERFGTEIAFWSETTFWGRTQIAVLKDGICFLSFCESDVRPLAELKQLYPECVVSERYTNVHNAAFRAIEQQVPSDSLLLIWRGTPFQQSVWRALLAIPSGETVSYKDVATFLGSPKAVRAVGTAVGRNAISYFVPCHRVLQASGRLGGYRWGIEVKQKLLQQEKTTVAKKAIVML